MVCAGRRRWQCAFTTIRYAKEINNLYSLSKITPLIFLQPHLTPTPSLSWPTPTLPIFPLKIPYVSQPQILNSGPDIRSIQCHILLLHSLNHQLVGTAMAVGLGPLLKVYSILNQARVRSLLYSTPPMYHTLNLPTTRMALSSQLLTMVPLVSTNKVSFPGDAGNAWHHLASFLRRLRWRHLLLTISSSGDSPPPLQPLIPYLILLPKTLFCQSLLP